VRLQCTTKLRGYSQFLVGERNPSVGPRLFVTFYLYDDVPDDIGDEMIAKGAEEVTEIALRGRRD